MRRWSTVMLGVLLAGVWLAAGAAKTSMVVSVANLYGPQYLQVSASNVDTIIVQHGWAILKDSEIYEDLGCKQYWKLPDYCPMLFSLTVKPPEGTSLDIKVTSVCQEHTFDTSRWAYLWVHSFKIKVGVKKGVATGLGEYKLIGTWTSPWDGSSFYFEPTYLTVVP